jgi:hypothetical protein
LSTLLLSGYMDVRAVMCKKTEGEKKEETQRERRKRRHKRGEAGSRPCILDTSSS